MQGAVERIKGRKKPDFLKVTACRTPEGGYGRRAMAFHCRSFAHRSIRWNIEAPPHKRRRRAGTPKSLRLQMDDRRLNQNRRKKIASDNLNEESERSD